MLPHPSFERQADLTQTAPFRGKPHTTWRMTGPIRTGFSLERFVGLIVALALADVNGASGEHLQRPLTGE